MLDMYRYVVLFPFIWLLAKSSGMAMQSVLHSLFLPTPFKRALAQLSAATNATAEASAESKGDNTTKASAQTRATAESFTEVLKPGALYRECSVITLSLPPLPAAPEDKELDDTTRNDKRPRGKNEKANGKNKNPSSEDELFKIEDDGEYGGEGVGRVTWEWFENHLKMWEEKEKKEKPESKETKPPST